MRIGLQFERWMHNDTFHARNAMPDSLALGVRDALRWATANGAHAMGLERRIGSLTPGKQADLIVVGGRRLNMPMADPVGCMVAQANPSNVRDALVAGRLLKRDGELVGVDLDRRSSWSATAPSGCSRACAPRSCTRSPPPRSRPAPRRRARPPTLSPPAPPRARCSRRCPTASRRSSTPSQRRTSRAPGRSRPATEPRAERRDRLCAAGRDATAAAAPIITAWLLPTARPQAADPRWAAAQLSSSGRSAGAPALSSPLHSHSACPAQRLTARTPHARPPGARRYQPPSRSISSSPARRCRAGSSALLRGPQPGQLIGSYAESGDLVHLLRSLGPGVMRFGGVTADFETAWSEGGPAPSWATNVLDAGDLRELAALASRSDWRDASDAQPR